MDKETKTSTKSVFLPTVLDMFKAGFHFGHTTSKWNPAMEKYIYTKKDGIHIIDLRISAKKFKEFVETLKMAASKGSVLVVGAKKQAAEAVREHAQKSGMFYISNRWPGGMLTNFDIVKNAVKQMMDLEEEVASGMITHTKKEFADAKKRLERKLFLYQGVEHMTEVPAVLVVIDGKVERSAIREAKALGVKIFGIVDTNVNPEIFDCFVPGNDDAMKSINMFLEVVSSVVCQTTSAREIIAKRQLRVKKLEDIKNRGLDEKAQIKKQREMEAETMRAIKKGEKIKTTIKMSQVEKKKTKKTRPVKDVISKKLTVKTVKATAEPKKTKEFKIETKKVDIAKLNLTAHEVELLKAGGVNTSSDIRKVGKIGLLEIKGIGEKTATKVIVEVKKTK